MTKLDNTIKKLSIRDFNVTQLVENCEPKEACPKTCTPSCNSNQVCVYKTITTCGYCPSTYCMDNGQLQQVVAATNYDNNTDNSSYKKTALIAGLTTGLVVLALITVTVAGFVFYKRRKLRQQRANYSIQITEGSTSINESIIPIPPMIHLPHKSTCNNNNSSIHHWNQRQQQGEEYYDYEHPQSPFIIGAQSLQIPHLDDTPDPSTNNTSIIRRSLNIQSNTATTTTNNNININPHYGLGRASSVKVTKLDNRFNNNYINEDLDDTITTLRRAISIKKSNSSSNNSSSSCSSNNDIISYAKPNIVRINTIMKRDKSNGMIRKTSIRTIVDDNSESTPTTLTSDNNNHIDFYICPPPPPPPPTDNNNINNSQISIQSSAASSHSTLGDGSITVFWEPHPSP